MRHAYDTVAEDYAAQLPDTRAEAPLDLAMVDAFAAAVTSGDDARVLDAGCGAGRMSRYLADRGCRVEGVDLSPGMVAMARRDHPDLAFTVGSLTDLPYPDDQFAGVMLWYSIIHTPPAGQARIFAEAARVLRPGGHLLVGFQSGEGTRDVSAATAGSVTRSSSSGTSTRRTRWLRRPRPPACGRCVAWCDVPGRRAGRPGGPARPGRLSRPRWYVVGTGSRRAASQARRRGSPCRSRGSTGHWDLGGGLSGGRRLGWRLPAVVGQRPMCRRPGPACVFWPLRL